MRCVFAWLDNAWEALAPFSLVQRREEKLYLYSISLRKVHFVLPLFMQGRLKWSVRRGAYWTAQSNERWKYRRKKKSSTADVDFCKKSPAVGGPPNFWPFTLNSWKQKNIESDVIGSVFGLVAGNKFRCSSSSLVIQSSHSSSSVVLVTPTIR